jgi:hypothetical protein
MAIEAKRGCGFRKCGGLYLVGEGIAVGCDRLPLPLEVCPTCNQGIKPSLGFSWIESTILGGNCPKEGAECHLNSQCEICFPRFIDKEIDNGSVKTIIRVPKKLALMWVGSRFYRLPREFIEEAMKLGVSKRIMAIPRGLQIGDLVLLAHRQAVNRQATGKDGMPKNEKAPGIFYGFHITRFEKIVTETMAKDEKEMEKLKARNITPVVVPDGDKDHQGTVYDKEGEE